jgi:hypothetical protein
MVEPARKSLDLVRSKKAGTDPAGSNPSGGNPQTT